MRAFVLLLTLTLGLFGQTYRISQRANGSPGTGRADGGELVRQRVWIGERALSIQDLDGDSVTSIVRLDLGKLYLVYPKLNAYKVRDLADFEQAKIDRAKARDQKRKEILASGLPKDEIAQLLAERGLREDGATIATVEPLNEGMIVAAHHARGYRVLENGREIARVFTIAHLPRPDSLFESYLALSAYPDAVEQRLAEIPGLPVKLTMQLDSGDRFAFTLECVADGVAREAPPAAQFDVPKDYMELAWDASVAGEEVCVVCGAPAKDKRDDPDAKYHWVCERSACRLKVTAGDFERR